MVGIYFSGTGNSKYCLEQFLQALGEEREICPLEGERALSLVKGSNTVLLAYSVQYSNIPMMVRDFIRSNNGLWKGKRVFLIATMGLFSGDGTGVAARLLEKYGAEIIGGLHLRMPDSIGDEKVLKKTPEEYKKLVRIAEQKIGESAARYKAGRPDQEGLGFLAHVGGLFGQRLYFGHKAMKYTDKLRIHKDKCIGCGLCVSLCPMKNLEMGEGGSGGKAEAGNKCTMCYRCINRCPAKAITLLGKEVVEQCRIEKYL